MSICGLESRSLGEETRFSKKQTLDSLRNLVGKRKNEPDFRRAINDFATENGFQEASCEAKDVEWAKFDFVWNRRKAFKAYVSTI